MITPSTTALFEALDQGACVMTSGRRLTRQVAQRYAEWKQSQGATAWPTPKVQAYDDWLCETWETVFGNDRDARLLLNADQESLLWEQVIRRRASSTLGPQLLQVSGAARAARRTWRRMHDWHVDRGRLRDSKSADTEAFVDWMTAVQRDLQDNHWLTEAELPRCLADNAERWLDNPGWPLWWLGFGAMPPAHRMMFELLEDRGKPQTQMPGAGVAGAGVAVVGCRDGRDQWARIARWARSELTTDPNVSVGIVCPDLHDRRDDIEEIFEDVLHPGLHWRTDAPRTFHISLGRPLAEYPIIQSALDLLQWTRHRIPFEVVSRVLRSPYLSGAASELTQRTGLEVALRRWQQESLTLNRLQREAASRDGLAHLARALEDAAGLSVPDRADPGEWAALFSDWLGRVGWPGDRGLDSHEFQTQNAWREQLGRFAALGSIAKQWSLPQALGKLAGMAGERILQFHDDQAPIQIMGALEADGLWFDKLWLADMNEANWPPAPRPDPFIPVSLQKQCGMPFASAHHVLAHARQRTENFIASAEQVRISFASTDNGIPVSVSPLLDPYPDGAEETGSYPGRVKQVMDSAPRLESRVDSRGPGLPGESLRGGVSLVADQARCPFRAFAHFRLQARELPVVVPGLDAGDRGKLVHDALRRLWESLGGLDTLIAMDETRVRALAAECADGALEKRFPDSGFVQGFLDIERRRLATVLLEWLSLERQRRPFRVIATELETRLELAGGAFRMRVDRIDELPDGRLVIIDYKTGQLAAVRAWRDPRIEEPQLPMYCLAVDQQVAALAVAGVRRSRCEMRGVGQDVVGIPGLKSTSELGFDRMDALKSWWSGVLGELVSEYRRGVARVEPKNPGICANCDVMSMCRIFERRPEPGQGTDGDE